MSYFFIPGLQQGHPYPPVMMPMFGGPQLIIGAPNVQYPQLHPCLSYIYESQTANTVSGQNAGMRKIMEYAAQPQEGESMRAAIRRNMRDDPMMYYPDTDPNAVYARYQKYSSNIHHPKN